MSPATAAKPFRHAPRPGAPSMPLLASFPRLRQLVCLGALLLQVPSALAVDAAKADELIVNGDAEAPGGWTANWGWSKADSTLDLDRAASAAHSGRSALRIVARKAGATTQWHSNAFDLKRGQAYRLRFAYRGEGITDLHLSVRMIEPHWTSYHKLARTVFPEWNVVDEFFVASADQARTALFFSLEDRGTLWLDDVSLAEVDLPVATPRLTENLLANAGFEVPVSGSDWLLNAYGRGALERDETEARHGRASLRVEGDREIVSAPLALTENCPHALGLWVKGDRPGAKLRLTLHSGQAVRFTTTVEAGLDWKHVSVAGNSLLRDRLFYVSIKKQGGGGAVWIDGVDLREGSAIAPAAPPARREIAVTLAGQGRVFTPDHPPEATFTLARSASGPAREEPLEWRLEDWRGEPFQSGSVRIPSDAGSHTAALIPAKFGLHRLVVRAPDAAEVSTWFAYLAPPPELPVAASRFGNHYAVGNAAVLETAARIGCRWGRAHWPPGATQWETFEPAPGEFKPSAALQAALASGAAGMLGMIDTTPAWAAPARADWLKRGGYGTAMPDSLDAWRRYVREVAAAYPQIDCWEIFNEPHVPVFWRGTDEELLELFNAAADELKKLAPPRRVVNWPLKLDRIAEHAGAARLDGVVVHPYSHGRTVDERVTENREAFASMRARLDAQGASHVTLWNTEYGPGDWGSVRVPGNLAQRTRAVEYMIKHTVAQLDQVERFFPYLMTSDVLGNHCQLDLDLVPRAGLVAYGTVIRFADGAETLGEIRGASEHLRAFAVRREGRVAVFVWSRAPGRELPCRPADGVRAFDEMVNAIELPARIGSMPLVLVGQPADLARTDLFAPGAFDR